MEIIHQHLTRLALRRNSPAAFALAVGLAAIALALRGGLIPYLSDYPFIVLFPAVLLSAVIGGLWPGLICTVACLLGVWFFFMSPHFSFAIASLSDGGALLIFAISSILMVVVAQQLRGALRRLHWERERSEAERERADVAVVEMNHRIKNGLASISSILQLQIRKPGEPVARQMLQDALSRVAAVAQLHEYLAERSDISTVQFNAYLHRLCADVQALSGHGRTTLECHVHCDSFEMDTRRAVSLGLLVNEVLMNIIKHAYPKAQPGKAFVDCRARPDGQIALRIWDEGVGRSSDPQVDAGGTLGMQIIRATAKQLGATLKFEQPPTGTGTMVTVTLQGA